MGYSLYLCHARGRWKTNIYDCNKKKTFYLRVASNTPVAIRVQFYQVFDLLALCHARGRWTTYIVLCEPQIFRLVTHKIKRTNDVSRLPQKILGYLFFY